MNEAGDKIYNFRNLLSVLYLYSDSPIQEKIRQIFRLNDVDCDG